MLKLVYLLVLYEKNIRLYDMLLQTKPEGSL